MTSHGTDVYVSAPSFGSFSNVSCGNRVYIGPYSNFIALLSNITIGNDVIIAPEVMIITGNHRYDWVGRTMYSITNAEKNIDDDLPVIIEDDVWIGARSIILKGVTIGEGSIVGAGSIVTKNVPPFSIAAGNPARVIKKRFQSEEDIANHKRIMKFQKK
jgi:acetyltransferase-like isoleucine patch superfamily enzyme